MGEKVIWYDLQQVTYEDLNDEQSYFENKIHLLGYDLFGNGVVGRDSLKVHFDPDGILNEKPSEATISTYETFQPIASELFSPGDSAYKMIAEKFQAVVDNVQALKLYIEVDSGWAGAMRVEIRELVTPTDIASDPNLATDALAQRTLYAADLIHIFDGSAISAQSLVTVDFSDAAYGDDISSLASLTVGEYYAIVVYRFGSPAGHSENVYVAINNSGAFAYGRFSSNLNGTWTDNTVKDLYFHLYSGGVIVDAGVLYIKGKQTELTADAFLSLENIIGDTNYIVVQHKYTDANQVIHPRTGNAVYSRQLDSYTLSILTKTEWDALSSSGGFSTTPAKSDYILLAIVKYFGYGNANNRAADNRFFLPYAYNGALIDSIQCVPCIDRLGTSSIGDLVVITTGTTVIGSEANATFAINNLREIVVSTIIERTSPVSNEKHFRVLGVVVGKLTLQDNQGNSIPGRIVAYSGRVKANVEARSGVIEPGDLLMPSFGYDDINYYGAAMAAVEVGYEPSIVSGTVIGKALQGFNPGAGEDLYTRVEDSSNELTDGGIDIILSGYSAETPSSFDEYVFFEFLTNGITFGIDEGKPVKVTANMTVSLCSDDDRFIGIIDSIASDSSTCKVQVLGHVEFDYTGTDPSVGVVKWDANGSGGIKINAVSGFEYFTLSVSTATKKATLMLTQL